MSLSDLDETFSGRQDRGEGPQTGGAVGVVGAVSAAEAIKIARRRGFKLEVEGNDLVYEAADDPIVYPIIDNLRAHKPEILELLQAERRAVLRHIAHQFHSSPLGQCARCSGGRREDDPFVLVFVGEDRADIHAECYPLWLADREAQAQAALSLSSAAPCRA